MGTLVTMIERHYGQTWVLVGIAHETARRRKSSIPKPIKTKGNPTDNPVPEGAVDVTPADDDAED